MAEQYLGTTKAGELGKGMPLIFLPGYAHPTGITKDNPLGDYVPVATAFNAAGFDFRLIVPDWTADDGEYGPLTDLRFKTEDAIQDVFTPGWRDDDSKEHDLEHDSNPFWLGGFSLGALVALHVAMGYGSEYLRKPNRLQGILAFSPAPFHIDDSGDLDSYTLFRRCFDRQLYPTDYPFFSQKLVEELDALPPIRLRGHTTVHVTLGAKENPPNHMSAWLLSRIIDTTPHPNYTIGVIPDVGHAIRDPAYYEPAAKIAQLALEGTLADTRKNNIPVEEWLADVRALYSPNHQMRI